MMNRAFFYSIILSLCIVGPQTAQAQLARKVDKDSSAYQGIVRKNLELRKEFRELERKYVALENERKVLIMHVKDLQTTRGATNAVIQDLKSKIAALRIEMLKDPQMVKTLDNLNTRIQQSAKEKDELQKRVDILAAEKTKLLNELNVVRNLYNKQKESYAKEPDQPGKEQSRQMANDLKDAHTKFQEAEDELTKNLRTAEKKNSELAEELQEVKELLQEKSNTVAKAKTAKASTEDTERIKKMQSKFRTTVEKLKDNVQFEQSKNKALGKSNQDLREELAEMQALLDMADAALEKEGVKIQGAGIKAAKKSRLEKRNKDLKKESDETKALLAEMQADLRAQTKKAGAEKSRLQKESRGKEKDLKTQISEMSKEAVRLEIDLKRAQNDKVKIGRKLAEFEERIGEIKEENLFLVRDRKEMDGLIKQNTKELEVQLKEAQYDQEYFKRKAKNASADKLMREAKIQDLEERTLAAESKLTEIEDELKTKTAKTSLQESEIMVLREEKSKLEQKLIKYIEKIIEGDRPGLKDIKLEKRDEFTYQYLPEGLKVKSKREIDQQKLDMHYNLAIAYDRRRMYKEERKEYLKCLKINPKDANVHYNLAILYDDKLNMNDKAIHHYKKFIQLRPIGEGVAKVKDWILRAEQETRLGPQMR